MKSRVQVVANPGESPKGACAKAKPLVTVIIATHNRSHCLPRALDSIYAQQELGELYDLEVIVVDDASTDATPEVLRRYPGLKSIRLPQRRGISAAMNKGLAACQGIYVTFLDDDDEWLPHKLRVQVPLLDAHPDVGVVYGQTLMRIGEEEKLFPEVGKSPSGQVFRAMLMYNFGGHHASLLVRRSAFELAGYFDESFLSYEDWDVSLRLAFHVNFLFHPGAVDIYNVSPQGLWLSRSASGAGANDAARALEKALSLLPDSPECLEVKRDARVRIALDTATRMADPGEAWEMVAATLRKYPEALSRKWVREQVVWILTLLANSPRTSKQEALRAAVKAFRYAPSSHASQKLLLRVAVRSVFGRAADAACVSLFKKAQGKPRAAEASKAP